MTTIDLLILDTSCELWRPALKTRTAESSSCSQPSPRQAGVVLGGMYSWGAASHGELGLGGLEDAHVSLPQQVIFPPGQAVQDIAPWGRHTLVLTQVVCSLHCSTLLNNTQKYRTVQYSTSEQYRTVDYSM